MASSPRSSSKAAFVVGGLAILVALVASGILGAKTLGFIEVLPGCGPQSGCAALTAGPWGELPWVHWPVSFIGIAYFAALASAWWSGVYSRRILFVMQLGGLASLGFIALMFALGHYCQWCALVHATNLFACCTAFYRFYSNEPLQSRSLTPTLSAFVLVTVCLAIVLPIRRHAIATERSEQHEANLEAIAHGERNEQMLALLNARHHIGPNNAAVTLVMFTDYQCPDCKRLERQAAALLESMDDVALEIKHFPFCAECNAHTGGKSLHPNACWAARAAEAASVLDGDAGFARMHTWLFEQKGSFTQSTLPLALDALGFDRAAFVAEMSSQRTLDSVKSDIEDAVALGVFFTPMIFINGVEYAWYFGDEGSLASAVNAARKREIAAPPDAEHRLIKDWRKRKQFPSVADDERAPLGTGPIEVVVYGDPSTEPTRKLDAAIQAMLARTDNISYHVRHFPIDASCNPHAARIASRNDTSCQDARLVEAAGIIGGPAARLAFYRGLLAADPAVERASILNDLGLDAALILKTADEDLRPSLWVAQDIAEKDTAWTMHAPVLLIDGRLVPRWQTDRVDAETLLDQIIDAALRPDA